MKVALTPIDTLFFRDSTPFDQGAHPQDGVPSVFPPFPPTVAGATRAALARENGWDGSSAWSTALIAALGDGPNVGPLRFTGPIVLRGDVPLFPLPRHVIASRIGSRADAWTATGWYAPGTQVTCDLGTVRLPVATSAAGERKRGAAGDKASRAARLWVTHTGLQRILDGQLPDDRDILDASTLWADEPRVGLRRVPGTRTAETGMLYSTSHVRLRPDVRIGIEVVGLPRDWHTLADPRRPSSCTLALGGESRLASVDTWTGIALAATVSDAARRTGRLTLVALAPLRLPRGAIAGRVPLAAGLRVACACADRPLRIGGWDSRQRMPLTLTNAVAPGTTLFCEVTERDALDIELDHGLIRVGRDTATGFGLCAVARDPWEETT